MPLQLIGLPDGGQQLWPSRHVLQVGDYQFDGNALSQFLARALLPNEPSRCQTSQVGTTQQKLQQNIR